MFTNRCSVATGECGGFVSRLSRDNANIFCLRCLKICFIQEKVLILQAKEVL